ncbi:hypothetical protein OIU84_001234 [Salix udensis]|uniref:NAC domain-containing protein n=1 Tax=Salix udensis TaxID=889485 RepID=A0AAD6K7Z5_9ROSI|nr:hypothetical protein OIU84_001234 [Salix udensis]
MNTFTHVPPGFRFHPTDEELVDYYLRKKVNARRIDVDVIKDVDLYKIEPWDLQATKIRSIPTGTRTNRATAAGFWKATGRDKAIYSKHDLIGMRKTLVFYKGRAPNGQKSDWIMHEYRLETDENGAPQEEGWVVCRVFKKRLPTMRKVSEHESVCWYDDQVAFLHDLDSPKQNSQPDLAPTITCNSINAGYGLDINQASTIQSSTLTQEDHIQHANGQSFPSIYGNNNINEQAVDQVTDWRVLDKFVASQLSQDDVVKENSHQNASSHIFNTSSVHLVRHLNKQDTSVPENASTSTSSCQIDLWK